MKKIITILSLMALCFIMTMPSFAQQQNKKTAAVWNFVNSGGIDNNEIIILTNRFSNYLVNVAVYKILEREKMDMILKEQDFTMTDNCNAAECAVQIGQLLGVDRMITGNIGTFGEVWTLDVRVIDVSTGEILKTQSENYEGKKEGLLGMIEGLAYTISGKTAPVKTTKTTTGTGSTVTGKTTSDDSGDEIKIGTVTKKFGSLEINCEMDGTLYINDKQIGEVTEGSIIPIEKLKVGEHTIKIVYSGGEFFETVNIVYNQKTMLTAIKNSVSTFKDPRDGKIYKTIKIRNQVWMADNLNFDAGNGSWCYDDSTSNCSQYGRLYNWETTNNVAPPGWHLPSKEEFEILLRNLGGEGPNAYKKIISGGTSGYNVVFGGYRNGNGNFDYLGTYANFWSSTEDASKNAWYLYVYNKGQGANMYYDSKRRAFSVRLLKD